MNMKASMEVSKAAEICRALSDGNRLRIIEMLTHGEKCACELLEQLHITQPTLSHHMKVLEKTGLVSSRRKASGCIIQSAAICSVISGTI